MRKHRVTSAPDVGPLYPHLAKIFAGLLTLAACALHLPAVRAADGVDIAKQHLPSGAVLQEFTHRGRDGNSVSVPAVASDSGTVAFLFKRNTLLGVGIVLNNGGTLEMPLPGTFGQNIDGAGSPVSIRQLVPGQTPQILVGSSEGASVGSYLNVIGIENGSLRNLAGGPIAGSEFGTDCSDDKPCKLLAWGKWTDHSSSWVHPYVWNGGSYVASDATAESYAVKRVSELAATASAKQPMPVFARIATAKVAADEFVSRNDFEHATAVYKDVLDRLDSPTPDASERRTQTEHGKAEVHRLLGKTFQSMGRDSDARSQFSRAEEVERSLPQQ